MAYKLVLVEATVPNNLYDEDHGTYDDDIEMSSREFSLFDLSNNSNYQLREDLVILFRRLLESDNERIALTLREAGFVHVATIKDRDTKLIATKKYILVDQRYIFVQDVDVDNLSAGVLRQLASDDAKLVQVVSKTSMKQLLSPKNKKVYTKEVNRLKAEKEKNAEANKKRQATKKKKEIEKAKRLLANLT